MNLHYYNRTNYRTIPQINVLDKKELEAIETISCVFPFKVNNYVTENLIDWSLGSRCPIFRMTFPQREMLSDEHYATMRRLLDKNAPQEEINRAAALIRNSLNPHPSKQINNIPVLNGRRLNGIQHKYRETVLFFPQSGQNCHAWCTFCFRWPQFTSGSHHFSGGIEDLLAYLSIHREVTDVLITGGDPLTMKTSDLEDITEPLLDSRLPVRSIRLGTKSLSWNPQRILDDPQLLRLFEKIGQKRSLTIVAHWTHPKELKMPLTQKAMKLVLSTGTQLRGQSALLNNINSHADTLAELLQEQVNCGCVPYYLFAERNTGPKRYFEMPLIKAWKLYREAISRVSGLARSVRGPVMSCTPGKVCIDGPCTANGQKLLALRFLQARDPMLVNRPFFAKFSETASWWDELEPAFDGDKEFFNLP
ncbi:MAG: lysine 2,3-aminomutase [bacterium]|nr:lysine 2,3-aminomutase [bacterium]